MILSMEIIKDELETVKKYILEGFSEPLKDDNLKNFIAGKSKMIRSSLALLWLKANNTDLSENIYKVLAAGEILHNASLLHDDVVDNAEKRRGDETIAKIFTPQISILAGDYLVSLAIEKLMEINDTRILDIFKECAKKMALTEIEQYFLRDKKPDIDTYIKICKGKTANLFSAIMESSAIISGTSIDEGKTLGELFGISFQIKNDLDEESAYTDNKNGTYTAKDIIGIENTLILLDNYRGQMEKIISKLPNDIYKRALEDLIR